MTSGAHGVWIKGSAIVQKGQDMNEFSLSDLAAVTGGNRNDGDGWNNGGGW